MKKIIFPLFFLMVILEATAQTISPSVIAVNGDYAIGSNGSLSWTIGETATELLSSASSIMSQGFQQPGFTNCNAVPAIPASISQTLISNTCGARVYRYTVSAVSGASGYIWHIPTAVGGVPGVIIDSGNIGVSASIKLKFVSNAAAFATDSIRVLAYNTCGLGRSKSAKLINTVLNPPVAPTSITITTIQSNVCGARIYRYAAPNLAAATSTSTAATDWQWSLMGGLSAFASLDSGTWTSQVIRIKYSSNAAAVAGDSILLKYGSACGNSLKKAVKLTNTLLSPPLMPASITITPVQTNICGARIYRYTAPALPAATAANGEANGWNWSLIGALSATAVVDSGSLTDKVVRIRFTSNAAAVVGDSVLLFYNSVCGLSPYKSAKLTNTLLSVPLAPASITITPVQTNVCGARIYRYSAPALTAGNSTNAQANGWMWNIVGPLSATAIIDSGLATSQVIKVRFTSNAAAIAGDSIFLRYNSGCGLSPHKALKLTNTNLATVVPATLTITPVQTNVCGSRIYRYSAPALAASTATTAAATGWQWSLVGALGATAVVDSGSLNSQVVRLRFSSNAASATGDSILLRYNSVCGFGPYKSAKLTNTLLTSALPASIIAQAVQTNVCGVRIYRYTAPLLTAATATAPASTGYQWYLPTGPVGSTGVLDSGLLTGRYIRIRYASNNAAAVGDSIRLAYTSLCGTGPAKALKLTNTATVAPAAPLTITTQLVTTLCSATVYRYIAPNLTTATSSAVAANGWEWSWIGALGSSVSIDSGTVFSQKIKLKFSSNAPASIGDSIKLRYTTICTAPSTWRASKFLNPGIAGCPGALPVTKTNLLNNRSNTVAEFNAEIYPNPSSDQFVLKWNSITQEPLRVRVYDMKGRCIMKENYTAVDHVVFGKLFNPGAYILEINQGNKVVRKKFVKQY